MIFKANSLEEQTIKCLLIDENSQDRKRLEKLLTMIEDVEIIGSFDASDKAILFIEDHNPDLVFLEIEMSERTGFDILFRFEGINAKTEFVFVSNSDHYAIKAINNGAFGYLVKPVDVFELREIMTRYKTSD